MPGAELSTSAYDGHGVVALRGDLDVTGAADAEAAIAALVVTGRCLIIDMSALDFLDCGSLAYWYPVTAVGAAAVWAGSLRGWIRGCRQPAHGRVGTGGHLGKLGASRATSNREYKEA